MECLLEAPAIYGISQKRDQRWQRKGYEIDKTGETGNGKEVGVLLT
jgi:hypothetical protein